MSDATKSMHKNVNKSRNSERETFSTPTKSEKEAAKKNGGGMGLSLLQQMKKPDY